MEDRFINFLKLLVNAIRGIVVLCFFLVGLIIYFNFYYHPSDFETADNKFLVEDINLNATKEGIHEPTGFILDKDLKVVIANCTGCHSAKLVTQNRATAEGWKNTIVWMQETQNLWDLGENEEKIVAYLAKYYAPEQQGRRRPLENIEWYNLVDSQ